MNEVYKKQVQLLLDVLPAVAKESCFAMHGGTAINLFVRDMPRLSVDVDLTYIKLNKRDAALAGINAGLLSIKQRIEALRSSIHVQHRVKSCKLQLEEGGVSIKIEVNMVGRGLLGSAEKMVLCDSAQEAFDAFCAIPIVPWTQLYGGKLCAALDRQHPRDLFDVKLLLDSEGLSNEIKRGLVYGLICSSRPTHEMLDPNFLAAVSKVFLRKLLPSPPNNPAVAELAQEEGIPGTTLYNWYQCHARDSHPQRNGTL